MLFTTQILYFGSYLTVGQANLTVERGCSHCKQCQEIERSVVPSRINSMIACRNFFMTLNNIALQFKHNINTLAHGTVTN